VRAGTKNYDNATYKGAGGRRRSKKDNEVLKVELLRGGG